MRAIQEIQQHFPTAAQTGLSEQEAQKSQSEFGTNSLTPLPREPLWKKFIGMFDDPIIKILLAAALLSMFVDLFRGSPQDNVPGSPKAAGICLGIVALAMIGAWISKQGRWIPTMMFVSAIVVFFVGVANQHASIEGLAVMVAVILATGVAFISEYKSDREFEILNSQKESILVKAIRNGELHTMPLDEVLVGDLVELETGDEVPADGRLVKATELYLDQSLMTGESEPVKKGPRSPEESASGPGEPDCLYRGTQVVDGKGHLLICDVGDETYLGKIAKRLSAEDVEEEDEEEVGDNEQTRVKHKLSISKAATPLQVKLQDLGDLISKVGYWAAGLIFLALFVRGMFVNEVYWPANYDQFLAVSSSILDYFIYMVIIIVVAVPEGLPMSVTVSLALAMRKMTRANSLVRQLVACETIGSATVICSDKTGTLTQNKMSVVRLFLDGKVQDRGSPEWQSPSSEASWPRGTEPLNLLALNAAANSTANLEEKEGKVITVGNSTEGALLQWLEEAGLDYRALRQQFEALYQIHFSSERKHMTSVVRYGDQLITLAKGAPEWILENCTKYLSADGSEQSLDDAARQKVEDAIRDSAGQAMRTLAFAYAKLPADMPTDEDSLHDRKEALEHDLVFIGFVAIRDPLRDDVQDAIEQCRSAGIEVKMITGDNVETARAIAYDIGLIDDRAAAIDTDDGTILTSKKFNELHARYSDLIKQGQLSSGETEEKEALEDRLAGLRVLARAQPLDKYKMVELLQRRDEVVAVTGDGTNDAPALKKADVGLAMGIAGTEVAKEASKIVLLDDAFSTIVNAVHWGRSLYENIQKFLLFQLTINVSALAIALLGPLFGMPPPFTVLQLLWINVIMDTFAAIALCSEPPRPGVMNLPPKKKDESIVTPTMVTTILTTGAFLVVVMMTLLFGMYLGGWFKQGALSTPFREYGLTIHQVSLFFSVYVFFQVWNQINCRALTPESTGFHGLFQNRVFLAILGTVIVVQIVITSVPFIGAVFFKEPANRVDLVEPLAPMTWLLIIVSTASILIFAEIMRQIRLRKESPVTETKPQGSEATG